MSLKNEKKKRMSNTIIKKVHRANIYIHHVAISLGCVNTYSQHDI